MLRFADWTPLSTGKMEQAANHLVGSEKLEGNIYDI